METQAQTTKPRAGRFEASYHSMLLRIMRHVFSLKLMASIYFQRADTIIIYDHIYAEVVCFKRRVCFLKEFKSYDLTY